MEQLSAMEHAMAPMGITEMQKEIRKNHTDAIYQVTDHAIHECENSLALLRDTMRELYPKEISLNVKKLEPHP